MKKAKVSKGIIQHVWPWTKNGIVKELPPQYRGPDLEKIAAVEQEITDTGALAAQAEKAVATAAKEAEEAEASEDKEAVIAAKSKYYEQCNILNHHRVLVEHLRVRLAFLKSKIVPDCIIDVPDHVKPGYVWNGKEYAPVVKKPLVRPRSDLIAAIAERLGVSYEKLWSEVIERKQARYDAAKKN